MKSKPVATISLDLDNQWSYMKIHGDVGWEQYPSYFNIFIPHVLDLLDEMNLKITFFIVGKDTESSENRKYLRMISERGHDIGNHSYNHESWLKSYSFEEIEREIIIAEMAIFETTGQRPIGFRGPGFSWSMDLLKVLESRGYLYDASSLPTYFGPVARYYYFMKSDLSKEKKKVRKELFGKFSDGFRRIKPYYINLGNDRKILEIPVTTMPIIKLPFHLSYLLYLSNFSMISMKYYLNTVISVCKFTSTPVSFLLHPLDLIGGDKINELSFFPGMNIPSEKKISLFKKVISEFKRNFHVLTLNEFYSHYA